MPAAISASRINSCRNRHCPKCQSLVRAQWLEDRQAELLPVEYFHVVFTLPAADRRDRLPEQGRASTTSCSAPPPRPCAPSPPIPSTWAPRSASSPSCTPGARTCMHHPHLHCVVPGGGCVARRPALDRLPAGLLPAGAGAVARCSAACSSTQLQQAFDDRRAALLQRAGAAAGARRLRPATWRPWPTAEWVVYAKPPFGGPAAGPRVSRPLHASRGHLQQPADRVRRRSSQPSAGRTTARSRSPR